MEKLRELRRRLGMPAMVLARKAGVSVQTLWLAERWGIPPRTRAARQRIADALGVEYETLWGEVEGGESTP
ncbi:MAG: hypothetical protein KatS3mg021_0064 [Fimbriimonadales bacterium]|jgi:DNA-binding XRE family transcriptional regulator|nr:MAG: hypothetical protein KatS3mg021_0064 [Fimbriimonadales bacterium]